MVYLYGGEAAEEEEHDFGVAEELAALRLYWTPATPLVVDHVASRVDRRRHRLARRRRPLRVADWTGAAAAERRRVVVVAAAAGGGRGGGGGGRVQLTDAGRAQHHHHPVSSSSSSTSSIAVDFSEQRRIAQHSDSHRACALLTPTPYNSSSSSNNYRELEQSHRHAHTHNASVSDNPV